MSDPNAPHLAPVPESAPAFPSPPPRVKTKVKKLRLLAILVPLALLAVISTIFGMMMAVASDLPALEQLPQVAKRKNSVLTDIRGKRLTTLTSNQGRIIVTGDQIGAYAKYAVIAVEDERFYENSGVDLRGIGRAFYQDVVQRRQAQGGSTIAQQFVKNALQAQTQRTVFEKLREAAMAYHLTRKWSKERILTEYLNTVYFGNGAYGIEAAARTYFSADPNHRAAARRATPCAPRSSRRPSRHFWPRSSPPPAAMTPSRTPLPPRAGATWCSRRCLSSSASPSRSTRTRSASRCTRRSRPRTSTP